LPKNRGACSRFRPKVPIPRLKINARSQPAPIGRKTGAAGGGFFRPKTKGPSFLAPPWIWPDGPPLLSGPEAILGRFGGSPLFVGLIQAGREQEAIELLLQKPPAPWKTTWRPPMPCRGNWPEALAWAQRRTATFPNAYLAWAEVANALAMLDRLDEAREIMQRVKALVADLQTLLLRKGDPPCLAQPGQGRRMRCSSACAGSNRT